jgi:hypothetical protein
MFWITLWLVLFAAWLYLIGWLPWKSADEQARLAKATHQPEPQPAEKVKPESAQPPGSRVLPAGLN